MDLDLILLIVAIWTACSLALVLGMSTAIRRERRLKARRPRWSPRSLNSQP
jgi:hypothetical protein